MRYSGSIVKQFTIWLGLALLLATPALANDDGFGREGKDRTAKDALENKPAPALHVSDWMNSQAGGMRLGDLRGKVVVLDFWGTW